MARTSRLSEADRANLVAYLDGELHGAEAAALEAKLSLDPAARAEADALRRTWQLLDFLPRPAPSPTFTSMTISRLSMPSPLAVTPAGTRRWLVAGWAAAVLAAGALGYDGGRLLPHRSSAPTRVPIDPDEALVRDLGVVENQPLYEHVDNIDFLRGLANPNDPDLFGHESGVP
jgi:hypothetical protein